MYYVGRSNLFATACIQYLATPFTCLHALIVSTAFLWSAWLQEFLLSWRRIYSATHQITILNVHFSLCEQVTFIHSCSGTGALAIFLQKTFGLDITTSDYDDAEIEQNIAHNCRVNGMSTVLPHIRRMSPSSYKSWYRTKMWYFSKKKKNRRKNENKIQVLFLEVVQIMNFFIHIKL